MAEEGIYEEVKKEVERLIEKVRKLRLGSRRG